MYWVLGPTVWKINPINADMIENGDFEKFPNQKWYLEWLEIKNQTQKWFEIISNIIVLGFGAKSLRYEEFHFRDISEPKWPSLSQNRAQKWGRDIVTSRKTRFSIRGIHHLLPDKNLARNDASRRLQVRAGVPSKKQLISEPKLK